MSLFSSLLPDPERVIVQSRDLAQVLIAVGYYNTASESLEQFGRVRLHIFARSDPSEAFHEYRSGCRC